MRDSARADMVQNATGISVASGRAYAEASDGRRVAGRHVSNFLRRQRDLDGAAGDHRQLDTKPTGDHSPAGQGQ